MTSYILSENSYTFTINKHLLSIKFVMTEVKKDAAGYQLRVDEG